MSDPSAQISGFYGPGNWAAWFITLMASWIPLFQNNHHHNFHFITYALYTNWAAIDLLRRLLTPRDAHAGSIIDEDNPLVVNQEKAIAASFAVVCVGMAHAYLQLLVCSRQLSKEFAAMTRAAEHVYKRAFILLSGITLPFIACVVHYSKVFSIKSFSIIPDIFPGQWGWINICLTPLLLFYGVPPVMTLPIGSTGTFYITEIYRTVVPKNLPWRWYIIPCAPQAIGEWDQAFALFLALFCFAYEFGPGLIKVIGEKTMRQANSQALGNNTSIPATSSPPST